jgi:glycosyltransferase involved in cell wall biosynthesis
MKVYFFLTSRYPTHKAYGVTTGETAREIREIGNQVRVIAPKHLHVSPRYDQYSNEVISVNSTNIVLMRKIFAHVWLLQNTIFVVTSVTFTLKCIRMIRRESPDVLWMRDYWSTLVLQKLIPQCKFVVEVHQAPSLANRIALRKIVKHKSTVLLTIQESLREELKKSYPKTNVFFGPMGASKEFFDVGNTKLKKFPKQIDGDLRVCYLGRMTSSGRDNGLFQLLEDWRRVPKSTASLTIIGLSRAEMIQITNQFSLENMRLLPSLEHIEVPKTLSEFDCGIVPYPEGGYHRTRFPIKIVEYCAAALNIIANDTFGNREILSDDFAYFYKAGNSEELLRNLTKIKSSRADAQNRARRGHLWAQDYTYSKRLNEVYPFLEGQRN